MVGFESKIELKVKLSWIQILVKKRRGKKRGEERISYGKKICKAASAEACPERSHRRPADSCESAVEAESHISTTVSPIACAVT